MDTKEAQNRFERLFNNVVMGDPTSLAPNGAPYITVMSGGVKEEGEPVPCWCSDEPVAANLWLYAAVNATRTFDILYWRQEPMCDARPNGEVAVYSRFQTGKEKRNVT